MSVIYLILYCVCRFPNGESGADVYDRITVFQDHLVRDINAGRFANNTSLVLVTHGLALRIFLMRWFHWSVDQVGFIICFLYILIFFKYISLYFSS